MKITELLNLEESKFRRLIELIVLVSTLVAPGSIILLLEGNLSLFERNLWLGIGVSFLVSIPLAFLGTVTYLHPFQTLKELARLDSQSSKMQTLVGSCLWSCLSAGIIYLIVNISNDWLSLNVSDDIKIQYLVVYLMVLFPFTILFYINSSRDYRS